MAEEPAADSGRGADPGRGPSPGEGGKAARRAARRFAMGGPLDQARPSAVLAWALERASGPGWSCPGASDDELIGVLGRWEATEAWCAAAKLGVIRELVRRRQQADGVSSASAEGLVQEVSNVLSVSLRAADGLIDLALALGNRLPATAAALAAGMISLTKARIIAEATAVLDDIQAAAAERLIADRLFGKTPGQIAALIARAVVEIDPDGARKRREEAEKEEARVRFWREHAGTAALAAFGLPPDEALVANQHIQDKAVAYRAAGMPGTMDQLRVRAFLDALTGADSRPAPGDADASAMTDRDGCASGHGRGDDPAQEGPGNADPAGADPAGAGQAGNGSADLDGNGAGGNGAGGNGPGGNGPGGNGADGNGPGKDGPAGPSGSTRSGVTANIMLTIPLVTLLGLAERPGEAAGLGALDPALARQLAASAARHPRSTWCLTVTDDQGHAIAHGCARPKRILRKPGHAGAAGNRGSTSRASPDSARDGRGFTFTQTGNQGSPINQGSPVEHGSWQLITGGREYTVTLMPIPLTDCDHRYEASGYRPGALLRHLVEVRDGQCTQPTCVRAARRCDFEHAVPWDKGGRTCGCNCGCRCRRDHQVKQSPGWSVTQPRPGWHQWVTPAGRIYTTEPMRYPI